MEHVTMLARVLQVRRDHLLVRDRDTDQTVRVNTPQARNFRPGNRVRIEYNGAMTMSIPPQISAIWISMDCRCNS